MSNKLKTTRWAVDLSTWSPTLNQLKQAVAVVQPEERIRLMKFHFMNDFLASLVGRLLMRKYISNSFDLPYAEVKLARDIRGKPYWVRDEALPKTHTQALCFNVSHHGRFVIIAGAVSDSPEFEDFGIGCDVMKLEYSGGKDLHDFFRIMNRKFAESEWRYIKQPHFNLQQQTKAFMRFWCLKEAYAKELGAGITMDLQKIVFSIDNETDVTESQPIYSTTLTHSNQPMKQFYFEEHMLHPEYCAAIAFRNFIPETREKFQFLDVTDLLKESPAQDDDEVIDYCRKALTKTWK